MDANYPYGAAATVLFQEGATASYNISASSVVATTSSSTETGTSVTAFNEVAVYTQQDCSTPTQFLSDVVYMSNVVQDVEVQAGGTATVTIQEP